MHLVILSGLMIGLVFRSVPALAPSLRATAPAVVLYLAGTALLGWTNATMSLRAIRRGEGELPVAVKRRNLLILLSHVWLLGGLAGIMAMGYGPWVLTELRLGSSLLASEALILAPFVVGLLVLWIQGYPVYRAIRRASAAPGWGQNAPGELASETESLRKAWTLREYLAYNIRHQLLFIIAPVAMILLASDCLDYAVGRFLPPEMGQYAFGALMPAAAGTVFLLAPFLIVRIWKTHRLGEGPLRDRLEEMSDRLGLKYRELLVWESGGMIANAGVMGLIGRARYVLLSDGLLERFDQRDVEAIFAHEAGHIIHHHIFYSALFTIGVIIFCTSALELFANLVGWNHWTVDVFALALLAVVWGGGFGWISRRFERQSDIVAAWALGDSESLAAGRISNEGAAIFARALHRVGQMNNISARQRNWRHGSIARRVNYVLWMGSTAGNRRRDDRIVRRIKCVAWLVAVAGLALMAWALK